GTTQTSATYPGAFGHRYAFASVATDNVGNHPALPTVAQASTDLEPPVLPPLPPPPPPVSVRAITARLVPVKVGKRKTKLVIDVFFADTGAKKSELTSPFQAPMFRNIQVGVRDRDGDGVAEQIVLTARKGRKTVTAVFPG